MKYLLDSHAWLWWLAGDPRLGQKARVAIANRASELHLSAASGWELSIKVSLGKLTLRHSLQEILQGQRQLHRVRWLEVNAEHCLAVSSLPFHHRDPFDRMLVAQVKSENLILISRDVQLDAYGVNRLWD